MDQADDRLRAVEISVSTLVAKFESHGTLQSELIEKLATVLEKHDHVLNGNGSDGLKVKVDRLMDREENRRWHFRAIWGAILAIGGKVVYTLFK